MIRILNTKRLANSKGSILVFSVIISIATVALGMAYLQQVEHQRRQISFDILKSQAILAAHAAMVRGQVIHTNSHRDYMEAMTEFYGEDGIYSIEYRYIAKTGEVDLFGYGANSNYSIYGESSVSSADFGGVSFDETVWHDMTKRSYANWLYISDRETQSYRPPGYDIITFWGPDTLDGKVHSNDMIHFASGGGGYWPVFEKEVTSCSSRFDPEDAPDDVHFNGGYQLNYVYFPFPITADSVRRYNWYSNPNLGVPAAQQSSKVTEIVLQPNYFLCRHRNISAGSRNLHHFGVSNGPNEYETSLVLADGNPYYTYTYPPNGALFIDGELWLVGPNGANHFNCGSSGEDAYYINGFNNRLTIGASGDIIIAQDVVYRDFLDGPDSMLSNTTAALGLISEKHILVWRNAPSYVKITAGLGAIGYNVEEDSSIHRWDARCLNEPGLIPINGVNGTISIDAINCYGWNNEKQELLIYGCLIQRERGLVHTNYHEGLRGYISKAYKYDNRFVLNPPPHFFEIQSIGNYYSEKEDDWGGRY